LPVYNYKEQFLKLLDENQCLILSGNIWLISLILLF
jgi:hypothetical protein